LKPPLERFNSLVNGWVKSLTKGMSIPWST
jgi:hypothetical protein